MPSRISELTAAGSAAAANEYEINEAGTSKKVTGAQIKTYTSLAPVWAAGTASANTWPKFTAGTLLTTPEVGAIELDATNFYGTTDAGNRGYIPIKHLIRANATRTYTSNTSAQTVFNAPTNGRFTIEAGTYHFEGVLIWEAMSATSGNRNLNLIGAGTATNSNYAWIAKGLDGTVGTAAAGGASYMTTSTSPASIVPAATGATLGVHVIGSFECNTAGTMIPTTTMVTAAASTLRIGSFMELWRVGTDALVSIGQVD